MSTWTKIGCWRHRAALEDRAGSNGLRPEENSQLDAHLHECAECRQSLDDALLATALLRQDYDSAPIDSEERSDEYSPNYSREHVAPNPFSMRVMSSIREEISRRSTPDLIWRPLELLASRFAVAAAVVLLMVSVYMAEFAPPLRPVRIATQAESTQVEIGQQIETGQAEVGAIMPEPPAQPTTPDEVLMSLAGEGQ